MKTINTSLPIYDLLSKQCFERGKDGGFDKPVPILTPRHRLPSFQWNAEADNMGTVTKVELRNNTYTGADKGTTVVNSIGSGYSTFTVSGNAITSAIQIAAVSSVAMIRPIMPGIKGMPVTIEFTLTLTSGQAPTFSIMGGPTGELLTSAGQLATAGANKLYFIPNRDCTFTYVIIENTNVCNWSCTSIIIKQGDITSHFPTLPFATVLAVDTYYSYNGDTLNYLLPEGIYYLKITTSNGYVLYSDWFKINCVYPNLITTWTNPSYETFQIFGTSIFLAINSAGDGLSTAGPFSVIKGETITVIFNYTENSGTTPDMYIINDGWTLSDGAAITAGLNVLTLNPTWTGNAYIAFSNSASNVNFSTTEVLVIRSYSDKYLTINFHNDCDLGDILYHEGFTQTVWFESETMEPSFPLEEEGVKDGNAQFVRSFGRQVKKYIARTKEMPDFIVELFNRMKLHDTVELIDLVGNENDVYNLEVEHEWLENDKYYAQINLTFDYNEAFVIGGCCNNLT
jgi:hypothetical protein